MKYILVLGLILAGCSTREADTASYNLSRSADAFEIVRRIVFYNGINGEYILTIEGFCSIGNNDKPKQLSVVCKTGNGLYKKHFLGLSDNVTYFAEQIDGKNASVDYYKVIFRPRTILPDIEIK